MLIAALMLSASAWPPGIVAQKPGEVLIGAAVLRTIGKKTSMDFFPVAVYRKGHYVSADSSTGDSPKKGKLAAKTLFTFYRDAHPVGSLSVESVDTKKTPIGDFILGHGKWNLLPSAMPRRGEAHSEAEELLEANMRWDDFGQSDPPYRVVLGINAKRPAHTGALHVTASEKLKVEKAMQSLIARRAKKAKIDPRKLKLNSFAAFDVDADGKREYVVDYLGSIDEEETVSIFAIGNLNGTTFVSLYDEPQTEVYPYAFDALDIDGNGVQEIVCAQGAMEAGGFMIFSKVHGKFQKVFDELEFGV